TEVEKALPVTCDLKSLKIEGRSGLVLIMHASEIQEGNMWQKKIAKLAIEKLSPIDMMGMLYFDFRNGDHRWHIPFQTVGENKNMATVAKITGGREYPQPDAQGTYKPLNPAQLPAIYMKETRLISQSFFHEKPFTPDLLLRAGPTEGLPDKLPQLHGFVRATPREGPLVQLPIMSPKVGDDKWPILAHWQYGLGKGVAF